MVPLSTPPALHFLFVQGEMPPKVQVPPWGEWFFWYTKDHPQTSGPASLHWQNQRKKKMTVPGGANISLFLWVSLWSNLSRFSVWGPTHSRCSVKIGGHGAEDAFDCLGRG